MATMMNEEEIKSTESAVYLLQAQELLVFYCGSRVNVEGRLPNDVHEVSDKGVYEEKRRLSRGEGEGEEEEEEEGEGEEKGRGRRKKVRDELFSLYYGC
jgi:hypothetical protein